MCVCRCERVGVAGIFNWNCNDVDISVVGL